MSDANTSNASNGQPSVTTTTMNTGVTPITTPGTQKTEPAKAAGPSKKEIISQHIAKLQKEALDAKAALQEREPIVSKFNTLKEAASKKDIKAVLSQLAELGIDSTEIARTFVASESEDPTQKTIKELSEKLSKYDEKFAELENQKLEATERESKQTLEKAESTFKSSVLEKAKAAGDKYAFVAAYEEQAANLVLNAVKKWHSEEVAAGREHKGLPEEILTKIMDNAEKYLEELFQKGASVKKGAKAAAPAQNSNSAIAKFLAPTTITNSMRSTSSENTWSPPSSDTEARQRAIALMRKLA